MEKIVIRDQGSGMEKFGSGIQDGKFSDPGPRIRDKHHGSEKLIAKFARTLLEPNNNQTLCG
jgi:hypothetical protein